MTFYKTAINIPIIHLAHKLDRIPLITILYMKLYTRTDTIKRSWTMSFSCVFTYFVSQKFRDSASCRKCHMSQTRFFPHRLSYLSFSLACQSSSLIHLPNGSTLGQHFPIFQFLPPRFLAHETSGSKPCD